MTEFKLKDSVTQKAVPCRDCERNKEKPKVCRKECEKWEEYEKFKSEVYRERQESYEQIYDSISTVQNRNKRLAVGQRIARERKSRRTKI